MPRNDTTTWAGDVHFGPERPFPQDESVGIRGVELDAEFRKPGDGENNWL